MSFYQYLANRQKLLKKRLRMANIDQTPVEYVKKAFQRALFFAIAVLLFSFFLASRDSPSFVLPLFIAIIAFYAVYWLQLKKVDVMIRKRAKKIDREVLFAGRFLLIKLNSGKPLINAIEEASSGFGEATEYFKDIMRELELGTPLEEALDQATEYCPSEYLKKILFQITNALKIGVDVTNFLEAILDEIAEDQLTQIKRYGKKLSSLTMFYMLAAIIVPSLGMTLFVVVASLINFSLDMQAFLVINMLLVFLQFVFITMFRSARPTMDV